LLRVAFGVERWILHIDPVVAHALREGKARLLGVGRQRHRAVTSGQTAPTGSVIRTVVPTPATLWTRMSPPWASIAVSAIDRPSPLPSQMQLDRRVDRSVNERVADDVGEHLPQAILVTRHHDRPIDVGADR
jgi:hypothetical protein